MLMENLLDHLQFHAHEFLMEYIMKKVMNQFGHVNIRHIKSTL